MRKFIVAVALLLGVVFILWRVSEVQAIIETLRQGNFLYLLAALAVQAGWLLLVAACFQSIYRAMSLEETYPKLLHFSTAAIFLNTIAPSAGMSGLAVFVSEAKRRNYSVGKTAVAGILFALLDYAAFLCILFLGLTVLIRGNHINVGEIVATVLLVGLALGVAFLIYLGMKSAEQLGKALSLIARVVNFIVRPIIHREYLPEARAYRFAFEASEGLRDIDREPRKMIAPFLLALAKQSSMVGVLWLSFLAFNVPVSIGTVIAGYSISYLFVIISPTPAGLGFVEGMLSLGLASMAVPLEAATVVTLAYRGFTFWAPLFAGMAAFRALGKVDEIEVTAVPQPLTDKNE